MLEATSALGVVSSYFMIQRFLKSVPTLSAIFFVTIYQLYKIVNYPADNKLQYIYPL